MNETMTAVRLYTTIDSRELRVRTYSVAMERVSVDDMALLASQSLGGPLVGIHKSATWGDRSQPGYGWEEYTVVVVACCPEEAIDALYWLEDQFIAGFEFPRYRTSYRLRGGELIVDNLVGIPEPEWD